MRKPHRKRAKGEPELVVMPPPERCRAGHAGGPVVRLETTVQDAQGGIGRPYKSLSGTLERMLRSGMIGAPEQAAGLRFNRLFNLAGLAGLWAADLARAPPGAGGYVPAERGNLKARQSVLTSLDLLGGLQAPGGSCAWHILGCEMTIESWSISRVWGGHRIDRHAASGILLADLGILRNYYRTA